VKLFQAPPVDFCQGCRHLRGNSIIDASRHFWKDTQRRKQIARSRRALANGLWDIDEVIYSIDVSRFGARGNCEPMTCSQKELCLQKVRKAC
jgi:hypothetical protein